MTEQIHIFDGSLEKNMKTAKKVLAIPSMTGVKDAWGIAFKRRFRMPLWCHLPETMSIPLFIAANAMNTHNKHEVDGTASPIPEDSQIKCQNFLAMATLYGQYNSETYAANSDLVEAMVHTDFSSDKFDFRKLNWPMKCFMICFPKGNELLNTPTGNGELTFLMMAKMDHGDRFNDGSLVADGTYKDSTIAIAGYCSTNNDFLIFSSQLDKFVSDLLPMFFSRYDVADPSLCSMFTLGLKFLTYFNVAKEPYTNGEFLGKVPVKRKKGPKKYDEYWSPNLLGDVFSKKLNSASGVSVSKESHTKRFHWRRGHYRNQPCGKGMKDRRLVWIEPMKINADLQVA